MLKYTGVKIELIRDINIFDFVNSSILGGICIAFQNITDDKNGIISSCDIASLYPYIMSKNLPIRNYKFIKYFNRNRCLDSNYSCLLNCKVYTTNKVRDNSILKQFPALISKTSIKYNDLSEFQRKNLKNNYKSSEKLITHLGYDKNCYISFEMYEMMMSLGYEINVKKILEYKHGNFMKPYIDFLFEKKSYYKKNGDIGMSNTFKILANSLSKCYSYICKNDIEDNKNNLKNDIIHSKGISNSYKNKYIDHTLFKKTLLENIKPDKISFNNISVKNQQIKTNTIIKNNIEFLNDKRYTSDINTNIPHTLYIE